MKFAPTLQSRGDLGGDNRAGQGDRKSILVKRPFLAWVPLWLVLGITLGRSYGMPERIIFAIAYAIIGSLVTVLVVRSINRDGRDR